MAGHLANLDFWLDEVLHAIRVLDSYEKRFENLKQATIRYADQHQTCEFPLQASLDSQYFRKVTPPRRIPHHQLITSRKRLLDAAYHLLLRLHKAGLIDELQLRSSLEKIQLRIDPIDLQPT